MTDLKKAMHSKLMIKTFVLLVIPFMGVTQVVNINNGLRLVAQGNISLVVDQGGMKNDGIFTPGNSTVCFSGGATTAVSGSQPVTFYNLTFKGTGNKTNSGDASVLNTLAVEGTTVVDADGISNDKPFTLKSSDTATARVDILTTGNIIGNVTVERFINTGTNTGEHAKSWQFLATPTTGQTYFQSWQENGLTPAGYGTWVTGTGTGFDAVTAAPSLKSYDQSTGNWNAVTNTGSSLQNKLGYMLFVRGDRTVTTYNGTPNNTNMRSKGVLFTPFNPPLAVPVLPNQFQTFGNPYASRIEFNKVFLASTGIDDVYYAWDPKLSGTYNLGGYQTISGVAGYIPAAGDSTAYYPSGIAAPYIESGQAVFVKGNVVGGNVNFNENCKVAGSRLVNKSMTDSIDPLPPGRGFLFSSLFTQTGMMADGNIEAFEDGLGNEINTHDALKIFNGGENFGLKRGGKTFAVEARESIRDVDTIFYDLRNLRQQSYQFRFNPKHLPAGITAFLVDRFTGTNTAVSVTDSSFINFSISATPGSNANDRFILVFKPATVVPVLFVSIAAGKNNDGTNQVLWKVSNEYNMQEYSIERSVDAVSFTGIGTTGATGNNGATMNYSYRDVLPAEAINYYRIKAIGRSGQLQYSSIVKVESTNTASGISVYPNPVVDGNVNINFINQKKGVYSITLSNKLGQVIFSDAFVVSQTNMLHTINAGKNLAAGTYQLVVAGDTGQKITKQVFVK